MKFSGLLERLSGGRLARVSGYMETIWYMIDEETRKVKPEQYGPGPALILRRIIRSGMLASLALSILSIPMIAMSPSMAVVVAALSLTVLAVSLAAPHFWRIVLGQGVNNEVPALLSFLLPYSSSPRYLTDVLVRVPREYFRWVRYEAERLAFLLDLGLDPVEALRELAKTTPSGKLKSVLLDYVHSLVTGAPRSQVTLMLLDHAVQAVRGQWRTYTEASRVIVEALTGILIAGVALAPLALFTGDVSAQIFILPLALAPIAGLLLLVLRPQIGDHKPSLAWTASMLTAAMAASIAYYSLGPAAGFAVLALASVGSEVLWRLWTRREEEALAKLKEAADDAKYGRPFDETLREARSLAPNLLGAIVDAARIAGRLGVGDTLLHVYRVIEEARAARRSLSVQGWILSLLAAIAPAVSVYLLVYVAGFGGGDMLAGNPEALIEGARLLASLSPLAPIPAAVAARGWIPSVTPSLAALVAAHYALGLTV